MKWRVRSELSNSQMDKLISNAGIPIRYKLSDLVEDFPKLSNNFFPDRSYYIVGPTGSGKTHCLCAMLKERILSRFDKKNCLFLPVEDLLDDLRSCYSDKNDSREDVLITRLKEIDILGLDDLGSERMTDWVFSKMYQIINNRYNNMKLIYITSNLDLSELSSKFDERIASRLFQMCETIRLEGKDKRIGP